ncbi:MAG: oligosaccharide flippase family protein [Hyphomicrobiales bacterium]|nr:oligosaccharide flippase family protein [Hyphomicrobiales bacterium]
MTKNGSDREASSRLLGWLGWSGLDAVGRLALLTGSTIIFSRILTPSEFGISALILTIVTFAGVFVGAPFEDALTQRRRVRRIDFQAALGASWLVGAVLLAASVAVGAWMARHFDNGAFRYLLPVAMVSIFFSGHSDIVTAMARRLRKFNDIAYATLAGHFIGIGLALMIGFLGYGIWALIAQRLLVVVSRAIILQWRIGFVILPAWSLPHVRRLAGFAGVSFLSRLVDNFTYLVFNALVQALYGFAMLGHVNMAMRLIEPVRGAIMATSHNLAFTFFARVQSDSESFRALMQLVVSRSTYVIAPVFAGMAAIAPVLIPMVTGTGWDDSVTIAVCLAIASALAVPANLVYTASSANGRPVFSLLSLVIGLASIIIVLVSFSFLGPLTVGLSRIAGDSVRAAVAILLPSRIVQLSPRERLMTLMAPWLLAAAMGMSVAAIGALLPQMPQISRLSILVVSGITIYALLVRVFARSLFNIAMARISGPRLMQVDGAAR